MPTLHPKKYSYQNILTIQETKNVDERSRFPPYNSSKKEAKQRGEYVVVAWRTSRSNYPGLKGVLPF
jgi:hypothetical protein